VNHTSLQFSGTVLETRFTSVVGVGFSLVAVAIKNLPFPS
jgi:hypothetical protein